MYRVIISLYNQYNVFNAYTMREKHLKEVSVCTPVSEGYVMCTICTVCEVVRTIYIVYTL